MAELARLEGFHGLFELGHRIARVDPAQIPPLRGGDVGRVLAGQVGKAGTALDDALAEVDADEGLEELSSGSAAGAPLLIAFGSSLADERLRCLEEDLGSALPRAPAEVPRMDCVCLRCAQERGREGKERGETALF